MLKLLGDPGFWNFLLGATALVGGALVTCIGFLWNLTRQIHMLHEKDRLTNLRIVEAASNADQKIKVLVDDAEELRLDHADLRKDHQAFREMLARQLTREDLNDLRADLVGQFTRGFDMLQNTLRRSPN